MKKVVKEVLDWYQAVGRNLPWRQTRDPYRILVSEIMLQQTQVTRVLEKYHEFLSAFPTVQDLAKASPAAVITVWKGLGYNRRALFLQRTAQAVVDEHGGIFPQTLEALIALPGVGDYTARAVLSFAFEQSVPMMDTNHRRFYQRVLFGIDPKKDKELLIAAEELLPRNDAYNWNQALMDFGSSICTTRAPRCLDCPIAKQCKAFPDREKLETVFAKKKKKKTVRFRDTDRYYRGRIIDQLREDGKTSIAAFAKRFDDIPRDRLDRIITQLIQDGLINKQNRSIVLPST